MFPKSTHGEITKRDLQRVMAARRALRAYEPYGPTARVSRTADRVLGPTRPYRTVSATPTEQGGASAASA